MSDAWVLFTGTKVRPNVFPKKNSCTIMQQYGGRDVRPLGACMRALLPQRLWTPRVSFAHIFTKNQSWRLHCSKAGRNKQPAARQQASASMLLPVPEAARQQHVNKAEFNITKHVVALRVPKQRCQELMRKFKG
eukprot:scaffold164015_cov21-Tisochrysis_lutea.AAC.1